MSELEVAKMSRDDAIEESNRFSRELTATKEGIARTISEQLRECVL